MLNIIINVLGTKVLYFKLLCNVVYNKCIDSTLSVCDGGGESYLKMKQMRIWFLIKKKGE